MIINYTDFIAAVEQKLALGGNLTKEEYSKISLKDLNNLATRYGLNNLKPKENRKIVDMSLEEQNTLAKLIGLDEYQRRKEEEVEQSESKAKTIDYAAELNALRAKKAMMIEELELAKMAAELREMVDTLPLELQEKYRERFK